jgi:7-alpha-hydroxysteroid dehydrogenase|tara:strand:+ start:3609 stop:4382 length:774 start_codon:yes stop_codon:yes gene_type:complete
MKVLITGGGTGIGRACAESLVKYGADVIICGRTLETLQTASEEIHSAYNAKVEYLVCDVTDEESVEECLSKAAGSSKILDGVVANAGGAIGLGTYQDLDAEQYLDTLKLNVLGTMHCVKHSIPYLANSGGGSFVGMSSIASNLTHRYFGAYTVSKAGIETMMRNAADEYGSMKIRFNAVRPGFIATEIMEVIPRDSEIFKSYVENIPLGDVGKPEDVASLVKFLLTSESSWITGQIFTIDGGHSLRAGPDYSEFFNR